MINHAADFKLPHVAALRAAAHHGLAEGVCNHFSVELPDASGRFLLNPRGLLWSEVQAEDIVMVDAQYNGLALDAADVVFMANHGVVVCAAVMAHAYDDLYYLERACQAQWLALSSGLALAPAAAPLAEQVMRQTLGERLQSELFFEALRRTPPGRCTSTRRGRPRQAGSRRPLGHRARQLAVEVQAALGRQRDGVDLDRRLRLFRRQ